MPFRRLVSVIRISPPASVQARPVAMPTSETSPFRRLRNRGLPRKSLRVSGVIWTGVSTFFWTILRATLRQIAADLALEVAHSGLARVALDDRP